MLVKNGHTACATPATVCTVRLYYSTALKIVPKRGCCDLGGYCPQEGGTRFNEEPHATFKSYSVADGTVRLGTTSGRAYRQLAPHKLSSLYSLKDHKQSIISKTSTKLKRSSESWIVSSLSLTAETQTLT